MTREKTKRRSAGRLTLTHFLVYAVMLTVMYFASTPEITGKFTEREERDFHVAAIRMKKDADDSKFVAYSLYHLRAGKVDLASVSFLLPQEAIDIPGGDIHTVTVLERHPEWQLVEYRYGNTHDSVSVYRAFEDRIEPVSYRITMHMGIVFWALVLLIPAWLVSALINTIWNAVAAREKSSGVP